MGTLKPKSEQGNTTDPNSSLFNEKRAAKNLNSGHTAYVADALSTALQRQNTVGRFLNAWLNFAFPGEKGNCEFNFCVCTWLYVVCKWLTHLLRSFKCDCGKKLAIRNY